MFPGMDNRKRLIILSILITETAERVAYFGFRAVLVLYFSEALKFDDNQSVALFAVTTAVAYSSPLLGALLADGVWGRYRTIWNFGWMYAFGLCLLTVGAYSATRDDVNNNIDDDSNQEASLGFERSISFLGLLLVCTGTGGIKPCVSAFGADQITTTHEHHEQDATLQQQQQDEQLRLYFASFYFCINIGALLSFAIIPIIKQYFGYAIAFFIPTIFMIFALLIFASQRKYYVTTTSKSSSLLWNTFQSCIMILRRRIIMNDDYDAIEKSGDQHDDHLQRQSQQEQDTNDKRTYEDAAQILHLFPILLLFPMFWMLYDQQSSVWILQAKRMALHGLEPEELNVINPAEILLFIPLFDQIIYPWMQRRNIDISPIARMKYGMFLASLSFAISSVLERIIQTQPPSSVHIAWQIPQLTILTVAEIFVNVTGLEFAYAQAPENMQALILALYLCMQSIGDVFGAVLYSSVFTYLNMAVVLGICAALMLLNLVGFSIVSAGWTPYQRNDTSANSGGDSGDNAEIEMKLASSAVLQMGDNLGGNSGYHIDDGGDNTTTEHIIT